MADLVSGRLPAAPADLQQPLPAVGTDRPVAARETPRETSAPVTWEMVYRFQAADDAQADRLAHAWAGTINAEFGCELIALRKVGA